MSEASWRRLERPPWNSWSSSGDETAAHWSVAAWNTETPLPMCGVTGMLVAYARSRWRMKSEMLVRPISGW